MRLGHNADSIGSASCPEGDLSHRYTASAQSVSQGLCVPLGIAQLDDRHNADVTDLLL
jgi:hypothetical protein